MMQITYQKRNGCIIQKLRKTMLPYKIGEETSMGWKVLNIEYEYKNKFYPYYEYSMLINKSKQRYVIIKNILNIILKEIKSLLYYFIVIYILYYIKIRIGI